MRRPELSHKQILAWADAHRERTGKWPERSSGRLRQILDAVDETWTNIDQALRMGLRGLRPGSSLARLLAKHRGKRNRKALPKFTFQQILRWADEHHARHGRWPRRESGPNLVGASDPAADYSFVVDVFGNIAEETHDLAALSFDIELDRIRDWQGRQTELKTYFGSTADQKTSFTYDAYSRITNVYQQGISGGNTVAEKRVDLAYNKLDQFTKVSRYANVSGSTHVVSSHYSYDQANRLTKLVHNTSTTPPASGWGTSPVPLSGYQYTYDLAHRIATIDSYVDGLSTFTYDVTNQLTAADHTGQTDETYGYDDNGNRDTGGYTVGTNNRISTDGTFNFTYDDEGNVLTKTTISTSEKEEYTWDHRNRLVTITFKNGAGTVIKTVDQTYDIFNRWIKRSIDPDGSTGSAALADTIFVYDANQIIFEFDGSSSSDLTHRYLWNPMATDQLLASEDATSLGTAGNVLWPLGDHLGTLRDIADRNEGTGVTTVINHRDYEAFGELVSETNSAADLLFGFTGRALDESTGKQYNTTRWYMPDQGEWMSEDWIGFLANDPNISRAVFNNPVSLTDPNGMDPSTNAEIGAASPPLPWYKYVEGRWKMREPLIPDPRREYDEPGIIYWTVGNLYNRTPIGDALEKALRNGSDPIGEACYDLKNLRDTVVMLPWLPQAWEQMDDLERHDALLKPLMAAGLTAGAVRTLPPAAPQASIAQRLAEFYRRLGSQKSSTADEALARIRRTMDEVEDCLSGIPKKDPPPPPKALDGRMYPPRDDFTTRAADGSISARTVGHTIEIGKDGSIKIINKRTGRIEFEQPGTGTQNE